MKISEILKNKFTISFEFFPPKTDNGVEELFNTIKNLKSINPSFVSVTYGAGGSTRERTQQLVIKLAKEDNLNPMAHLTCISHTKNEILEILNLYKNSGIDDILALRGDPPLGSNIDPDQQELKHTIDLINLIKNNFGDFFSIGGAAFPERHPESPSIEWEIKYFKLKVESGLDFAITQLFFDNNAYYKFIELVNKANINIPIIPGIMPITNFKQVKRFVQLTRATIPFSLTEKLLEYENNSDETFKIGVEYAIKQCEDLIRNNVPGLHFYTLNKSNATMEIFNAIKYLIPDK